MKFTSLWTDEAILKELGNRLTSARLELNLTQAALAEQAGVSKSTVERLESGQVATQLSSFLRVCRSLGWMDRLETIIPEPGASPMDLLKRHGRKRQRASGRKQKPEKSGTWTWGEPE